MSSPAFPGSRRDMVAHDLAQQIHEGTLKFGDRLAGEHRLSETYAVSRGTVRQALSVLQKRDLITTQSGVGSFVTFDGLPLDGPQGWAHALAAAPVSAQVISIAPVVRADVPDLPEDVELEEGIAVRRVRQMADGRRVSYECATVPASGSLASLPTVGLPDGSLTTAMRHAGIVVSGGNQQVSVRGLRPDVAKLLGRAPGEAFLYSVRTSFTAGEQLAEHVISFLDPEHFSLTLEFGQSQ